MTPVRPMLNQFCSSVRLEPNRSSVLLTRSHSLRTLTNTFHSTPSPFPPTHPPPWPQADSVPHSAHPNLLTLKLKKGGAQPTPTLTTITQPQPDTPLTPPHPLARHYTLRTQPHPKVGPSLRAPPISTPQSVTLPDRTIVELQAPEPISNSEAKQPHA